MNLNQSQLSKLPRYEQIRHLIQKQLAEQKWQIGEPIPSEHILAETYQVSIGTIRKAIDQLVRDGLLTKIQGKGTFVKYPDFNSSLIRFFRHRSKTGEPIIPTGHIENITAIDGHTEINTYLQREPNAPLIYIERTRLLDGMVMVSEKIWLPFEPFQSLLSLAPEQFENLLYPLYINVCGQLILSAREQLTFLPHYSDPYLQTQADEPVIKIRRFAQGMDGTVLEYRESYGRAQDFFYETVIS
ncbi:GntR family transcriptional regulator [Neisseria sp. CCUG17229]|uniref:GntR family transcriptional regulator n=1 Tax=Neisseria sp. CCUG17229 TaxID=3392036 RepID=UPI003A10153A